MMFSCALLIQNARRQSHGSGGPPRRAPGVNKGPLDEIDRKLVRAAAITSRETGLTIAAHTGDGAAALEELEIVTAENASTAKFVWVHAQNERDHDIHEKVARAGAWVEFDGVGSKTVELHLECVRFMTAKGLLKRILISQRLGLVSRG
jgi:phosphotriesterase-related protein